MSQVIEAFIDGITDATHKINIQQPRVAEFQNVLNEVRQINPYQQTPENRTVLLEFGIHSDPMASKTHGHPATKAIENALLDQTGKKVGTKTPLTCIYMKEAKMNIMRRNPNNTFFLNKMNTVKDLARYNMQTAVTDLNRRIHTEIAFMHDAIHYYSLDQVYQIFLANPKMRHLYATCVIPPEAIHQHPSLYPTLYTLNYIEDVYMVYKPDNKGGAAYIQPLQCVDWLKHRKMRAEDAPFQLNIEKLESIASHHLLLITRDNLTSSRMFCFDSPELIQLPSIYSNNEHDVQAPIRKELFMKMVAYVHSIANKADNKKVTTRDLWAKLRQVVKQIELVNYDPVTLNQLVDYMMVLSAQNFRSDSEVILKTTVFHRAVAKLKLTCKDILHLIGFGSSSSDRHYAMLRTTPFSYDQITQVHTLNLRTHTADLIRPPHEPSENQNQPEKEPEREKTPPKFLKFPLFIGVDYDLDDPTPFTLQLHNLYLRPIHKAVAVPYIPTPHGHILLPGEPATTPFAKSLELFIRKVTREAEAEGAIPEVELLRDESDPNHEANLKPLLSQQIYRKIKHSWRSHPLSKQHEFMGPVAPLCSGYFDEPENPLPTSDSNSFFKEAIFDPKTGLSFPLTSCHHHFEQIHNAAINNLCLYQAVLHALNNDSSHPQALKDRMIDAALPLCTPALALDLQHHLNTHNWPPEEMLPIISFFLNIRICLHMNAPHQTGFVDASHPDVIGSLIHLTWNGAHFEALKPLTNEPADITIEKNQPKPTTPAQKPEVKPCEKPQPAPAPQKPAKRPTLIDSPPQSGENQPNPIQILTDLGFTLTGGNKVTPLRMNKTDHKLIDSRRLNDPFLAALKTKTNRNFYRHTTSIERIQAFSSDLKNGIIGTLAHRRPSNRLSPDQLYQLSKTMKSRDVRVMVICGVGGSGKSTIIQDLILSNQLQLQVGKIHIVVPTVNLQQDWRRKIKPKQPHIVKTYENALQDNAAPVVVMDDISKLPPGYIDAYLNIHCNVQTIIITGDTRQSTYHIASDNSQAVHLSDEIDYFTVYSDYYINATHRNPRNIASLLDVYSEKPDGKVTLTHDMPPNGSTILVPSHTEAQALGDAGQRAFTYAGCQGLTLPIVHILFSRATQLCSDRVMYTALSRASEEIRLINTYSNDSTFLEKINATPYLKNFLDLVYESEAQDEAPEEVEATEPTIKTHLPIETVPGEFTEMLDNLPPPEEREIFNPISGAGYTQTVDERTPEVSGIPRHKASDISLNYATIDARLKTVSDARINTQKMKSEIPIDIGRTLWLNYRSAMKLPTHPQPFNPELWLQSKQEIEAKYLSKTVAQLKNAENRQDPDRLSNTIDIFLKSQWVLKPEKFAQKKNKPGQTIASFTQEAVMRTGCAARYVRRMEEKYKPENILIYCEKTQTDLEKFRQAHWKLPMGRAAANDYTAFDQSQDECALHFEILRYQHWNIPSEEIDFYVFLKLHARTFLGTLTIMRLTGEGPTYDANTAVNIAFDHTKYDIPDNCARLYSGDDMARDMICPEKPSWNHIEKHISLKSKPEISTQPIFCGWKITSLGVIRDPFKLYISYCKARDTDNLKNVALSYRHDLLPAYNLGDKLFEVLTSQEMEYHRRVCRDLLIEGHIKIENGKPTLDAINEFELAEESKTSQKTKRNKRHRKNRQKPEFTIVKLPDTCNE
nr:RNA-dependent RNA polymerase [Hypera postica associated alphaflexivirus]